MNPPMDEDRRRLLETDADVWERRAMKAEAERDRYKQALETIADIWQGHAPGTDPRSKVRIAQEALDQQAKS